jgi:Uma2 family endonuclease
MSSPARRQRYTYREYLALERHANVRHEFFDGHIYAMAGGTPEHAAFCMNVGTALNVQLRGRGCRVHSSDLLVRVLETGLATYPDITVVCGRAELDPEDRNTITNPVVIVEVLSHYQRIPSLREVVLVAHDERLIEIWRREAGSAWIRSEARSGSIRLASIDCTLEIDDVYRDELAPR